MKIRSIDINDPDDKGKYHILEVGNFEYANPVEQVSSLFISSTILLFKKILAANGYIAQAASMDEVLHKRAVKEWDTEYKKIIATKLPDNLFKLLEAPSKREQIKSLKGLSLTEDELVAFLFMAYEKYGYKYSQYKTQHNHKKLDETQLPEVVHIEDDGALKTIGKTNLTRGQQRQIVEHRKVTVSKFLDNGKDWHCFFMTFRSLGGKENYKNGQPHLHYISNRWEIARDEVLKQLTRKDYSLPSLPHIDLHTHTDPKGNSQG